MPVKLSTHIGEQAAKQVGVQKLGEFSAVHTFLPEGCRQPSVVTRPPGQGLGEHALFLVRYNIAGEPGRRFFPSFDADFGLRLQGLLPGICRDHQRLKRPDERHADEP
jgi:hypothetical protein